MKFLRVFFIVIQRASPLAEGRELKLISVVWLSTIFVSPLAEGRELKYLIGYERVEPLARRPSRRGVN